MNNENLAGGARVGEPWTPHVMIIMGVQEDKLGVFRNENLIVFEMFWNVSIGLLERGFCCSDQIPGR